MTAAGTATSELPTIKDVKDLLDGLLGQSVEIKEGTAWSPAGREPGVVAEYTSDKLRLCALAMTDLRLSVFLGAALGLLPRGGAEDMIDEKDPSAAVLENLYEVLNILSSMLNTPTAPHVRITRMHGLADQLPADVGALTSGLGSRLDLAVTLPAYGTGRLSIVLA